MKAGIRNIVDSLNKHTNSPHHHCGHHRCNKYFPATQMREQVYINEAIMQNIGNQHSKAHSISHTLQVDKRRIAENARIGAHEAEAYYIEDQVN